MLENYKSFINFVGWFTALHFMATNRCTAGRKAHANIVDESTCLMANDIHNEVVTIHRSQEVMKMPSSLHVDIFCS
jgi:hypothetical protein